MRVAMIGHKRTFGREGGIEVVVEELSTRMVKKGHEVVCYDRKKKGTKVPFDSKGVKIKPTFTIERKSTDALVCSLIASIKCLFSKFDVIHYHGIGPSVMLFIPKIFKKKVVVTVHGLNYKTPKWKGLGAKMMILGEKVTAKFADRIIVLSKEQQKYFKEKYNRDTFFISNGVSINDIIEPSIITDKYNLEKNGYILFLSRIVPGKGLEYLIEAYKKTNTSLPLIIAGGSEFVNDFYKNIVNSVSDDPRIKMIGFVSGQELQELYSNAALFVFPSEAEGMPMCLLEAMSYNVPCLVSDIPENIEVGKDYIHYFKSKNIDDLYKKLNFCLSSKEISNTLREYIVNNFNWDVIVDYTLECYK